MLLNAKRGCGNFTLLGSYVTVALAASLVGLHVIHGAIYSLCGYNCISWFIGVCILGVLLIFCVFGSWMVLHYGRNLFWVIFIKIHRR